MSGETFLGAMTRFACRRFVLRMDGAQIIVASLLPAFISAEGLAMPDENTTLAYIGYIILSFAALRFITAPYFLWKEDKARISDLEERLDSPRVAEKRRIAELMAEQKIAAMDEVTRIRRTLHDRDRTESEKKAAFRDAARYSDKFWGEDGFSDLWQDFKSACDVELQAWLEWKEKKPEGDRFEVISEMKLLHAAKRVDDSAFALLEKLAGRS